jgi:hypothetical protein
LHQKDPPASQRLIEAIFCAGSTDRGSGSNVVEVSGRRKIEVTEGKKISLGPGSVMLAEDVTGKGHITRVLGTEDAITLVIPIADSQ